MVKLKNIFRDLRYWIIEMLVQDMPVVMNMNIVRPPGYEGIMTLFPEPKRLGIFSNNVLMCTDGMEKANAIITPKRDISLLSD
jgi:hypothetical protein